jgi:RimJ/RimL family protein N-acetyltransferase
MKADMSRHRAGSDERTNEFGQPIGPALAQWREREPPPRTPMVGHWCRIEPVKPEHAASLWEAHCESPDQRGWTYLSAGPFADAAEFERYIGRIAASNDPLHHAIVEASTGRAVGTAALMRIDRTNGVIEIGSIAYSRRLQRTTAGTEALYLFMRRVFDELGYRRFEWKCDHLNAPSRAAALRYGFTFEGIFRHAVVYKGRSRDTAWYSIVDAEWPRLRRAYERWLSPENFDAAGRQKRRLADVIATSS